MQSNDQRAAGWASFDRIAEHYIDSELELFVSDPGDIQDVEARYERDGLPVLLAETELFINERVFEMLGRPAPSVIFESVGANTRPLMIAARQLVPVAYLELTKGEPVEIGTLYGVGEYLYPVVREMLARKLGPL